MSLTTRARRGLAGTLATALAASGLLALASPSQADPDDVTPVTNASLTWNLNDEQGGGAFNGSCNFLSAGKAGNTGSSRAWTKTEYTPIVGNVRIEKPGRTSPWVTPIWETRCLDRNGKTVTASSAASTTENRVRLSAGTGSYASDGSGTISWTGSFTSAFYGGMTYWTATDPTLTVAADGTATLTADLSGYGASMTDTSLWVPLETKNDQVIANFSGVDITATGYTAAPQYTGVDIDDTNYALPQVKTGSSWGSFPQQFVDFQQATGQSSYWYSSGGQRDAAKPAGPVSLTFGTPGTLPVDNAPPVVNPAPAPAPAPAPPATPAKATTAKPVVKITKRPTTKKAGKATVTVKSATGSKPAGKATVTITKGKTKRAITVTVKNGKATVKLPKLKKGTWKLKVSYAGNATHGPSTSKTYTVKSK